MGVAARRCAQRPPVSDYSREHVSLPAYQHRKETPGDDSWAEMREAQALVAKTIPISCVAITVDTGDPDNIHPIDKKEVGDRLGLCALAGHYGLKVPYSGPTLSSVEPLPGGLKPHFAHTDGGLVVKGEKLGEFSIAGDDHKWHWADARIEGDTVIVSSESVPNPKAAHYVWQSNPAATLFNGAGFRLCLSVPTIGPASRTRTRSIERRLPRLPDRRAAR